MCRITSTICCMNGCIVTLARTCSLFTDRDVVLAYDVGIPIMWDIAPVTSRVCMYWACNITLFVNSILDPDFICASFVGAHASFLLPLELLS